MIALRKQTLSESLEDYLEEIYEISRGEPARVRDIAAKLDVSMASVSSAMKRLREKGLIKPGRYDYIELTPEGEALAARVSDRHDDLHDFLHRTLGIDEDIAQEDACHMEHALSRETLDRIKLFQDFLDGHEPLKAEWRNKLSGKKE